MSKHVPVFILRKDVVAQILADRAEGDGGGAFAEIIDREASIKPKPRPWSSSARRSRSLSPCVGSGKISARQRHYVDAFAIEWRNRRA